MVASASCRTINQLRPRTAARDRQPPQEPLWWTMGLPQEWTVEYAMRSGERAVGDVFDVEDDGEGDVEMVAEAVRKN